LTLICIAGDLHTNSTVAVSPDEMELDDGGIFKPSPPQQWINERWEEFWTAADQRKNEYGVETVVILTGELADDNRHPTTQMISKHSADIGKAALKVLELPQLVADRVFVTRGTEAHVGLSGGIDENLARAIHATPDSTGRYARWSLRVEVDGYRIDAAHHPGTSWGRPWTRGADANRLAQMVIDPYVRQNVPLPHLIVRGHTHKPSDSYDNHPARAVILPSWQLSTSFGYRLGGDLLPIGGMQLLVEDGMIVREWKHVHDWPLSDWSGS
jgi:hypothetical protein